MTLFRPWKHASASIFVLLLTRNSLSIKQLSMTRG